MNPFDCCLPKESSRAKKSRGKEFYPVTVPSTSLKNGGRGPREEDVDKLVRSILSDPSINISVIPDSVEQLIYKSTIQLTLNAFYSFLSSLDGTKLMAHQIHLKMDRENELDDDNDDHHQERSKSRNSWFAESPTTAPSSGVDDNVLEEVAGRLLANRAINQRFLPDQLEHLLYMNCLKVVFRILDLLASSLRVTVCGHDVGLFLEPAAWQEILVERRTTAKNSLDSSSPGTAPPLSSSTIDQEKLRDFARQEAGITEELGFWDSLFVPKEFVAQLHASLYGLILGIMDDMLANTKIEILSDRISLDIISGSDTNDTYPEKIDKERRNQDLWECEGEKPLTASTTTSREQQQNVKSTTVTCDSKSQNDEMVEERMNIGNELLSIGFENERKVIMNRFQNMTPHQRAVLARDLHKLMSSKSETIKEEKNQYHMFTAATINGKISSRPPELNSSTEQGLPDE